ncbi:MAG: hypothetical protein H0X45_14785, partial [Planctomycetes bacterium]|nr:hypothetical protein [Planctomycetota bacterium]
YALIVGLFGEDRGTRIMRKYTFFYCNGLPGVRRFRDRFMRIDGPAEFAVLVDDFFSAAQSGHAADPVEHLTLFDRGTGADTSAEGSESG